MNDKTRKVLLVIFDYIVISVGVVLFVMAWTSFLLPNDMIDGGLTGASALLSMVTGISVDIWYFSINTLLLILAWIILGRSFGIKTIYAIVLSSALFRLFGSDSMAFLQSVPGNPLAVTEKVLVPIIGGLLEAVGLSLIIMRGGSTGGTDILALIVNKFWPVTLGRFYLFADLIVITLLLFIPGHCFTDVIYGYITMGVCAYVLDLIMLGKESSVQLLVFSDKYKEIADYVNDKMERGVTALESIGWYTQKERKVLLIVIRRTELSEVTKVVKDLDSKAFVTVVPANNVYGEGFGEMKTGIELKKKK
ncbi:MAG: YitT family protein [Spirochaetales bacterium]|nr:YitT family protein [Spirochaetales bacterium]